MHIIAAKMLKAAQNQVGMLEEGGNNRGPNVVKYQQATVNLPGNWPWCAAFMAWCLRESTRDEAVKAAIVATGFHPEDWRCRSARAFSWINWAEAKPADLTALLANPKQAAAGDIIVFDFNGPKVPEGGHIGIIESVSGETINTIEGNTNGLGERESESGDGVWRKKRTFKLVKGIIRLG